MGNATSQNQPPAKQRVRINFYSFFILIMLLLAVIVVLALYMNNNVASFRHAKQAERASVAVVKAESQHIDSVWRSLPAQSLLSYTSAKDACISTENGQALSTCWPHNVFATLSVRSNQAALPTGDAVAQLLENAGWQQRNYTVRANNTDTARHSILSLSDGFQNMRLYYASPQKNDAKRCLSLIFSSAQAQNPGWKGYIGKCTNES